MATKKKKAEKAVEVEETSVKVETVKEEPKKNIADLLKEKIEAKK